HPGPDFPAGNRNARTRPVPGRDRDQCQQGGHALPGAALNHRLHGRGHPAGPTRDQPGRADDPLRPGKQRDGRSPGDATRGAGAGQHRSGRLRTACSDRGAGTGAGPDRQRACTGAAMMGKTTMMTATTAPPHAGSAFWRQTLRLTAVAAVLGSLLGLAPVGLEPAHGAQASHLRVGTNAYGRTQNLEVGLNKSIIVDLPADVHEVIVSQPGVASAIVRSKRRAIIQGVGSGGTNIFFLDRRGDTIAVLDVSVGDDGGNLVATLARVIPGSSIQVQTFGENVVLSGSVQSGDDLEK